MVRGNRFLVSKQVLIIFLVLFLAAAVFVGTSVRAQTIAGGPQPLVQAENADSWSQVSTSPTPPGRYVHAMATTPSGDVLLFGGVGSFYFNDTWRFNTATNSWSQVSTSPTPPARRAHAMATTPSGVLLFGGWDGSKCIDDTWQFNTTTNSWSQVSTSPTPPARYTHTMAALPSGNVLLFGGWNGTTYFNDTWQFNTATNSWSQVSTSPTPPGRWGHAMAATPAGDVLLFGGYDGSGFLDDTWRFNPATNSWSQVITSPAPSARYYPAMTGTPSGALLFGGVNYGNYLDDTWLFDTATNIWSQVSTSSPPPARVGHAMATTPSGDVLLFGGIGRSSNYLDDTWLFGSAAPPSTVTLHLQPGWNLVSIPAVTDPSPSTVFAGLPAGWVIYAWDGANSRYLGGGLISLVIGNGFWLKLPGSNPLDYDVLGTPSAETETVIPLASGWNIVGVPYDSNFAWSAPRIRRLGGDVTLDQAVSNGWMVNAVYFWTGTGYGNAQFAGGFQAGNGYWLKALTDGCSLVFFKP